MWAANLGQTTVMVWPLLAALHSLLMKRPSGCEYLVPLGAVSCCVRFAAMVEGKIGGPTIAISGI